MVLRFRTEDGRVQEKRAQLCAMQEAQDQGRSQLIALSNTESNGHIV